MPPYQTQPSNPVGYGIASFLNTFTNSLDEKKKEDERLKQKQAYYDYLEKITGEKLAGQQKVADIRAQAKTASGAGKVSPSDKYFVQNFTKARDTFLTKYAQPYRHPNMLTNMDLAQKLQSVPDDERQKIAEMDFAKDDPTGHDLISNPENIAHYKQILQSLGGGAQQQATPPMGGQPSLTAPPTAQPSLTAPPVAAPPAVEEEQ